MTHILHIACDFPDKIDSHKTVAVENLVKSTTQLDHTVFSLNRRLWTSGHDIDTSTGSVFAMKFAGLPYGIGLRFFLQKAAKNILKIIRSQSIAPDLIHSHKLTFEGPIAHYLSQQLNIPMVCSFRGDTDFKLIRFKPGYRRYYQRILHDSRGALFIAPWAQSRLREMWPAHIPALSTVLPNIVDMPDIQFTDSAGDAKKFVTVFHLKEHRRKNIRRLLAAFDSCVTNGMDMSLDIIGGGSADDEKILRRYIQESAHPARYQVLGHMSRETIAERLGGYAALLLPSYPETFGMVYLESLHAGIPFLHSRDAGVDGYFSDANVSIAVDHDSVESIAEGITQLARRQESYKDSIRELAGSNFLDQFRTENISRQYIEFLQRALQE